MVAIGQNATATGDQATAVGGTNGPDRTQATSIRSSAFGSAATASGQFSTAIGAGGVASGDYSVLVTGGNVPGQATGVGSSGFGAGASATAFFSTALGVNTTASGNDATAVGSSAKANFTNSTAIGTNATTTRVNQVAIGTATNTYTMAGITSAASLGAQSGPVSLVTTDAAGNLATLSTSNIASVAALSALDGRVTNLETSVRSLNADMRKAFEGSAVAIAMGGAALPDNKRFAISANWGTFSGENAFGGMAQIRLTDHFVANAALGAGFARGGVGGRVGGTLAW
jgi:hypothetical protein